MKRLSGLDALRGIAALSVAMHHWGRLYGDDDPAILPGLAVDLFFMLSGFVMARTYEARMHAGMTVGQFLAIRYRRLFLPMAIGSTFGLVWAVLKYGQSGELLAAYVLILAFLPAWWMANCFLLNGPCWSLFVEIACNALHASGLWRLSRQGIFILWAAMAMLFCILFFAGLHWGPRIGLILLLIPRSLCCYLMGILIFRIWGDKPLGNSPMLAIASFPILLVAALLGPIFEAATTLIAAPFVIRAALALEDRSWALWLGAISYPLYATHVPVIRLAVFGGFHPAIALVMMLAVASAIAWGEPRSRRPSSSDAEPQTLPSRC